MLIIGAMLILFTHHIFLLKVRAFCNKFMIDSLDVIEVLKFQNVLVWGGGNFFVKGRLLSFSNKYATKKLQLIKL